MKENVSGCFFFSKHSVFELETSYLVCNFVMGKPSGYTVISMVGYGKELHAGGMVLYATLFVE